MGRESKAKATRKERFLAAHPVCCYCATARSVEVDHCPPRVFFDDRVAPEGYEFPACHDCNQEVRNVEQVVACFAAMRLHGAENSLQTQKLFRGATNNMPGLAEEMRATFASRPLHLRSTSKDDLVHFRTGPIVSHCMDIVGHKVSRALFYKHMGAVLQGYVFCRMTPTIADGEMLEAASSGMRAAGPIARNRVDLSERFRYDYLATMSNGFFAAAVRVGDQLAYLTFVLPAVTWESFRNANPVRASEIAKFGRPDLFGSWLERENEPRQR
jgi:hypothetical protein